MASSRKSPTGTPVINSYGAPGAGKDYDTGELSVWEADTDIGVGDDTRVLEIYGTGHDDGNCQMGGATCNAGMVARIVRPASGNILTAGAITSHHFDYTTANNGFTVFESTSEIQDIVYRLNLNADSANKIAFYFNGNYTDCGAVGCVAIDCTNAYATRNTIGFYITPTTTDTNVMYAKNCIAHNGDNVGFYLFPANNATVKVYNCSALGNAGTGFDGNNTTYCLAYGCGANGNGTNFDAGMGQVECSTAAPTLVDLAGDDFHLAAGDSNWKDADDNDPVAWHAGAGYDDDIDGDTRSGNWDIGADEYVAAGGGTLTINIYDSLNQTEALD